MKFLGHWSGHSSVMVKTDTERECDAMWVVIKHQVCKKCELRLLGTAMSQLLRTCHLVTWQLPMSWMLGDINRRWESIRGGDTRWQTVATGSETDWCQPARRYDSVQCSILMYSWLQRWVICVWAAELEDKILDLLVQLSTENIAVIHVSGQVSR